MNHWEFPLLARYRLHSEKKVGLFVSGGAALEWLGLMKQVILDDAEGAFAPNDIGEPGPSFFGLFSKRGEVEMLLGMRFWERRSHAKSRRRKEHKLIESPTVRA